MKIVLAMSGGVDSGCAGALLRRAGHEVIGATLLVDAPEPAPEVRAGIAESCAKLGIEHHFIDATAEFRDRVVVPAAHEYAAGRTPNPCCCCNPAVKFGILRDFARRLGAGALATGHYVRLGQTAGRYTLRRGRDRGKDQSYFLTLLPGGWLPELCFPLGELEKSTVRRVAADFGFTFHDRAESQELCFVPPGCNTGDELFRRAGLIPRPGRILYRERPVGRHGGVHRVTLGQRQGLEVALGVPAYVKRLDAAAAVVELTTDPAELLTARFRLNHCNFLLPPESGEYEIQVRYRSRPVRAAVVWDGVGAAITPEQPLRAVTPGQIGALYRGDTLCGGGIIDFEQEEQ